MDGTPERAGQGEEVISLWPRFWFLISTGRPRVWWGYTSDTHNGYQTGWARGVSEPGGLDTTVSRAFKF
jgi:hypothetical protein